MQAEDRYLKPKEIAYRWCVGIDTVIREFRQSDIYPDVLILGNGKKKYLRIPPDALQRAERRRTDKMYI